MKIFFMSFFQVSLAVHLLFDVTLVISNVTKLQVEEKVTVGIGVPFQLMWAFLGWFIVSVNNI